MKGGWRHTVRQTQPNADGEVSNNKNVKSDEFLKKQPSLATVDAVAVEQKKSGGGAEDKIGYSIFIALLLPM